MGPGISPNPELDDPGARTSFALPAMPDELIARGEFWRREPRTRYVVLFLLTLLTTTAAGTHLLDLGLGLLTGGLELRSGIALKDVLLSGLLDLPSGLWYSLPVLTILGAHEFGHYLACVYYRVNASLPYFLPLPFPPSGTLGAVIRIRQPIPSKHALFDIGIAGPLAGFVVLIPFLIAGMMMSTVMRTPTGFTGLSLGEPLLLKAVAWVVFGPIADGYDIFLHPMGMAAWWGMLATALNLFPVGQLDGGHITYAVLGRTSTRVSLVTLVCLVGLATFVSGSWVVWTTLLIAMMGVMGIRHPAVSDEHVPLNRGRFWLAVLAMIIFIVCFTPTPIEIKDIVDRPSPPPPASAPTDQGPTSA